MMRIAKINLTFLFCLMATLGFAAPTFPQLTTRVVDQIGLLPADTKQAITDKLIAFEAKSTAQVGVVIIESLQNYGIRQFGLELAREWALGQKNVNNGVLLLIAPTERKVSIEVGYGLEDQLTDALAYAIIHDKILPQFKQDKMAAGIVMGVDLILQSINGDLTPQSLKAQNSFFENFLNRKDSLGIMVIIGLFILLFIILLLNFIDPLNKKIGPTRPDNYLQPSSGYASGSFSGGGGSFGGGGASGSW